MGGGEKETRRKRRKRSSREMRRSERWKRGRWREERGEGGEKGVRAGGGGGGSHADLNCSSINTKLPAVRALNRDQTARKNRKGSAVSFPST